MEMFHNAISWFEIPVDDFDRAKKFYSAIFAYEMPEMPMGHLRMGFLLHDQQNGGIGGAIVEAEFGYTPSRLGPKVYLNGGTNLKRVLDRVEEAGGQVTVSKFLVAPGMGYVAGFLDTEGNEIYLHSPE
jgi:predicted enzyme related to lactoylglutathione lyase